MHAGAARLSGPVHAAGISGDLFRVRIGSSRDMWTRPCRLVDIARRALAALRSLALTAVYPSHPERRPGATEVSDLTGRYLMPGLFDSHAHLTVGGRAAPAVQLRMLLDGGVTSVRDMAGLAPVLRQLA
jgi:imidazolonepropionase-like amidohydrolase